MMEKLKKNINVVFNYIRNVFYETCGLYVCVIFLLILGWIMYFWICLVFNLDLPIHFKDFIFIIKIGISVFPIILLIGICEVRNY